MPQPECLKTAEIYCFRVLETGSRRLRCCQAQASSFCSNLWGVSPAPSSCGSWVMGSLAGSHAAHPSLPASLQLAPGCLLIRGPIMSGQFPPPTRRALVVVAAVERGKKNMNPHFLSGFLSDPGSAVGCQPVPGMGWCSCWVTGELEMSTP